MEELLTIEYLCDCLDYDPDTGVLRWTRRPESHFKRRSDFIGWNKRYPGKVTGSKDGQGYLSVRISGRLFLAHRVAWALHQGVWPADQIDHIDGCRTNNRISNLRAVTREENGRNQRIYRNNNSGVVGVFLDKQKNRWKAQINANGRQISLGNFEDFLDAVASRKRAEREYGFHPNHGRTAT